MIITRRSILTGETHSWDIGVTQEQLDTWNSGIPIQNAMPHLTVDEREFLMTGITPSEWDSAFFYDS